MFLIIKWSKDIGDNMTNLYVKFDKKLETNILNLLNKSK